MRCPRLAVAVALVILILPDPGGHATDLRFSPPRAGAQTQVTYDFGPNVSLSVRTLVQDTVTGALPFFAGTFQHALGVPLTVRVYSTREEVVEAYAGDRRIPREEAARLMGYPSVPRAFAGPDLRSVWMYLDGGCLTHPVSLDNLRCSIKQRIYHELFHVWTFQFGMAPLVEKERAATEWLNEGLADFASYLGIQRLGMFSLQDILLYVRRQAMNYEPVSRLSELDFTWGNFEPAYHVSALAIFRLAGNEPARLTTFLRHPNFRQDWRRAFELTFGRSVPAFELEFKADLEAIVADGRRVTLRIIGDGKIVPGTRVGLARVGMSVESLIAEIGPPDGSGTAAGGSRRLQWTLQERAYREATHGTARLLIWTGANGARVEQAIAYSGAFRTPGGNTVTSPLTALLQEFPARRVQPAGAGFEWAFGDGISFLYRVPSRAILAIGVGR